LKEKLTFQGGTQRIRWGGGGGDEEMVVAAGVGQGRRQAADLQQTTAVGRWKEEMGSSGVDVVYNMW
jgi:hypothetical protein